jgi:hypothetical protein
MAVPVHDIDRLSPLPLETITNIFSWLDPEDLCNIRLLSRNLQNKVHNTFTKRCFHSRCHILSKKSLEALREISNHPAFSPAVQELQISVLRFQGLPENSDRSGNVVLWNEHEFMWQKLDVLLLAQSLGGFKNCTRIRLVNNYEKKYEPWGAATFMRHCFQDEQRLLITPRVLIPDYHAVLRVILAATVASRFQLKELSIECTDANIYPMSFYDLDLAQDLFAEMVSSCITSLEQLHIGVIYRELGHLYSSSSSDKPWIEIFTRFVGMLPISRLIIDHCGRNDISFPWFNPIADELSVANLKVLEFRWVHCSLEMMLRLLRRHRCLGQIIFFHVNILSGNSLPGTHAWKELISTIVAEWSVPPRLTLKHCLSNGKTIGLAGNGSVGNDVIIIKDRDSPQKVMAKLVQGVENSFRPRKSFQPTYQVPLTTAAFNYHSRR